MVACAPLLQLLSGQAGAQSLAVYCELAFSDVAEGYEAARRGGGATCMGHGLKGGKVLSFSWRPAG
jgi:hypothetical protein